MPRNEPTMVHVADVLQKCKGKEDGLVEMHGLSPFQPLRS